MFPSDTIQIGSWYLTNHIISKWPMQRSLFQSHHLLGKVFPFLELILGKVSAYIIPELGVNCILFRFSSDSSALFTPGWLPRAMLKTCYGGSIRSQIEAYASFKATSENSQSIVRKNTACIYIITYVYIYIYFIYLLNPKTKINMYTYVYTFVSMHQSSTTSVPHLQFSAFATQRMLIVDIDSPQ